MKKLYTRSGDDGTTSLSSGRRLPKTHPIIEAGGTVDELSAHIGLLRSLPGSRQALPADDTLLQLLLRIQRNLFYIGCRLAEGPLRSDFLPDSETAVLETFIDRARQEAGSGWQGFILPGGSPEAARAHLCRTVCRRAERCLWRVAEENADSPADTSSCRRAARYLNRLSDFFYALSKAYNRKNSISEIIV